VTFCTTLRPRAVSSATSSRRDVGCARRSISPAHGRTGRTARGRPAASLSAGQRGGVAVKRITASSRDRCRQDRLRLPRMALSHHEPRALERIAVDPSAEDPWLASTLAHDGWNATSWRQRLSAAVLFVVGMPTLASAIFCSPFHPWWHFRRVHPWVRNHVRPSSAREQLGRSITHVPHLT